MAELSHTLPEPDLVTALRENEQRLSLALESNGDGIWDWNIPANSMYYSPHYWQILGFQPDEAIASVQDFDSRVHEEDKPGILESTIQLLRGDIETFSREYRLRCKDGSYKWVLSRGKVVKRAPDGQPERVIGTISDITSHLAAETKLRLAAEVFEQSTEAMLISDKENHIVSVNRAFTEITGYTPEEVIGRNPRFLSSGRQDHVFYQSMWAALQTAGHWRGEVWNRRKNGRICPEWLSISTVREPSGKILRYIAIFSDIGDSKQTADRLHYLTTHDALTGLSNLAQLEAYLQLAVTSAQERHAHLALLTISLNALRQANELWGHPAGDHLLKLAAERLQQIVPQDCTISRQGGEHFHVLLPGVDAASAHLLAESIIEALSHFQLLDQHEFVINPCIGISLYPGHGMDATALLENADAAMFHLVECGRHGVQFYSEGINAGTLQQMTLKNSLHQALEQEEFLIHYQPLFDVKSNRIVGAEALLRWKHPEMDMVSPAVFIELAEESGVILPIGDWMLKRICQQIQAWQADGVRLVPISINLTTSQFNNSELPERIESLLKENSVNPFFLEIEITENTLSSNLDETALMIRELKKRGIRVSVDDFGIGHSSLAYLKRFHIDKLKIDPSFIANLINDADDSAIVRAMVSMAHSMRLAVVAEGVETQKQLDFLQAINCDQAQGYFYCEALPAKEFAERLQETKSTA